MFELTFLLCALPLLLLLFINNLVSGSKNPKTLEVTDIKFPKSYPIIGHFITFYQHKHDRFQWLVSLVTSSPTATFTVHLPLGRKAIVTGNPATVEHILKTKFSVYQKGHTHYSHLRDLLGDGIFNVDGQKWKFQRQVASYEFNNKSLRRFVEKVVDSELSDRLIPVLSDAAKNQTVIDFQDILTRFAFDNICKIAFGYDPEYLSPSMPEANFAMAFEAAVMISSQRFRSFFPILWKIRRFLNIGSEKKLKEAVYETRAFARTLVRQKTQEMMKNSDESSASEAEDLLSRFLKSGHTDEDFVTDIVISFMLAGRDTTSSALTWFFWLLHNNKHAEEEIVKEINGQQLQKAEHSSAFEEAKDMVYTHAALCESMRLYPPVPADRKEATSDDILPDGTVVKKDMGVTYHLYAMGRMESIWGADWAQYRPERWLNVEENGGKWKFMPRDPFSYPVFQAGPRICLGKEMAFLQMKRVVAGILARFRLIPVMEKGFEPVYLPHLTAKMKDGLPVKIQERVQAVN